MEGERKRRQQCEPGQDLAFTVHGLWPQFERGFPTECGPSGRSPSRAVSHAYDRPTSVNDSRAVEVSFRP